MKRNYVGASQGHMKRRWFAAAWLLGAVLAVVSCNESSNPGAVNTTEQDASQMEDVRLRGDIDEPSDGGPNDASGEDVLHEDVSREEDASVPGDASQGDATVVRGIEIFAPIDGATVSGEL